MHTNPQPLGHIYRNISPMTAISEERVKVIVGRIRLHTAVVEVVLAAVVEAAVVVAVLVVVVLIVL